MLKAKNNHNNKPGNSLVAVVIIINNNHAFLLLKVKHCFCQLCDPCSWWRCSTPHCWREGDCGQAQWVPEKRDTHCKQHAWNGNVERKLCSECHNSVLTRWSLRTFLHGLVSLCYTAEMEQSGCSQCSEMGRPLQQEVSPQPPIQQDDWMYVHADQIF